MKNFFPFLLLVLILTGCASRLKFPKEELSFLKFCFAGDMGKASIAQFQVAQALKHEKCHQIFFLGDLIYPNGLRDAYDPLFERRFNSYYHELPKLDHKPNLNIVLGNHDYNGNPDAWIDLAKTHSGIHFPARYYWRQVDDVCLITLDSNRNFEQQAIWLKAERPKWKGCRSLIALAHHNLTSHGPSHKTPSNEVKAFYEQNVLGKFDFLITGHEHVVEHMGEINGTTLLISGAAGAVARGHKPGYITVEKTREDSATLTYKLKTIHRGGEVKMNTFEKIY